MNTTSSSAKQKAMSRPQLTVTAALLSMVGPISINTYLPSFPDIEATFGVSRALLTQSLTVYLVTFAIFTLFWGPLSDRTGRRPVILISMFLYLVSSAGCALSQSAESFLLLRGIQGLAAGGAFVAGRAMIRDSCDTRTAQKIMSQVVLLFAMAPAMAPVLGGWLQVLFGWRSVFWFLCGFAVLLLIMGFFVKETLSKDKRQYFHPYHVSRVYWQILRRREFVCLTLSLALMFAGMFVYIAGAPTVIYGFLGLSGDDFGWQFIPMVAGMMLGSFVSGRMVHSWGAARTLTIGFCIGAVGAIANLASALLILPATIISVVAPLVVYSMSYGLVMPVITIMALDYFPERRGSATAVQGFTQVAGNAMVASIAIPLLHAAQSGFAAGQLLFLVLAVILMLYFGFLEKKMADIGARK